MSNVTFISLNTILISTPSPPPPTPRKSTAGWHLFCVVRTLTRYQCFIPVLFQFYSWEKRDFENTYNMYICTCIVLAATICLLGTFVFCLSVEFFFLKSFHHFLRWQFFTLSWCFHQIIASSKSPFLPLNLGAPLASTISVSVLLVRHCWHSRWRTKTNFAKT